MATTDATNELAAMLTEVKHRRPLTQRMDALEEERVALGVRLSDAQQNANPKITAMEPADLEEFAKQWRTDWKAGR
ncbi:MAG: hypothetical protein KDG50_12995 [Chromatiales bacterium]|nr:hypothetical protein [Chromatiales bacterium]